MDIKNTSGWNTPWLRKLIRFSARELDYDWARVRFAHFSKAHNCRYRGGAWLDSHTIRVKVNPLNEYPVTDNALKRLPPLLLMDAVELVVLITAHEIAHLERWDRFARPLWQRGGRDTECERATERLARDVLKAFRRERASPLQEWGEPGPGPIPPKVVHHMMCRRCGRSWRHSKAPRNVLRRSCGACFKSWKEAEAAGEFLLHEVVSTGSHLRSRSKPNEAT